jgi:hypothetical protein
MQNALKIGATGEFPQGKLNETDDGELNMAVAADKVTNLVILRFGTPVLWIGMNVQEAEGLAGLLTQKAYELSALPVVPDGLTEAQRRFIYLDKKKAEYKQFLEDYKTATEALVSEIGVGAMFQDADGTVYKATEPNGKFVYFDKYEICRTRREGEAKGSLSMTEARNAGFTVEGK